MAVARINAGLQRVKAVHKVRAFRNKNEVGRIDRMSRCAELCLIYNGCIHDVERSTDGHESWRIRRERAGKG